MIQEIMKKIRMKNNLSMQIGNQFSFSMVYWTVQYPGSCIKKCTLISDILVKRHYLICWLNKAMTYGWATTEEPGTL